MSVSGICRVFPSHVEHEMMTGRETSKWRSGYCTERTGIQEYDIAIDWLCQMVKILGAIKNIHGVRSHCRPIDCELNLPNIQLNA